MSPLTARQQLALTHACLRAVDTQHPRFHEQGARLTSIVTVNK